MDAQRWQQIEALFHEVVDLPRAEAVSRVHRLANGDTALTAEVLRMLEADQGGDSNFRETVAAAAGAFAEQTELTSTQRVGPYRLLHEIGRGGMGAVFLAERDDDQYRKQVAVKLLPISLGLPQTRERFLQERQILAGLDHPYIARLLDGGTTDRGEPYLIMDYVEGERIDQYCERNKVSLRDRCRILLKVCEAVACAHRNLIVHRDLKPANILVTNDGTPKLLDFGIAKMMAPEAVQLTQSSIGVGMTPEYASPEQVLGNPVTTATDVFALGATLYHLVTGSTPYTLETGAPVELVRAVCERDIPLPSKARRADLEPVPADLERIILMAMQKEPPRRYATVEQFRDDLERFLDGDPVLAQGDSWKYKATKFLRRHWLPVTAAAVVVLSLTAAAIISIQKAREAEQRFAQVRKLSGKFLFEFHDAIEKLPGSLPARKMVVSTALEYLDSLSSERSSDRALMREVATAYERVGDMQGNPFNQNLGDMPGAERSYQKAISLRERLGSGGSKEASELALSYARLGDVFSGMGKPKESEAQYAKGLAVLPKESSSDRELLAAQYKVNARRGDLLARAARMKESLESYKTAFDQFEKMHTDDATKPQVRSERAKLLRLIGRGYYLLDQSAEGQPILERARDELAALVKQFPDDPAYLRSLMLAHSQLATNYHPTKNGKEIEREWLQAIELGDRLATRDPQSRQAQSDAGYMHTTAAEAFRTLGKNEQAVQDARTAIGIYQKLLAEDNKNWMNRLYLASNYITEGQVQQNANKAAALESFQRALDVQETILKENPANRDAMLKMFLTLRLRGEVKLALGRQGDAIADFEKSLGIVNQLKQRVGDTENLRQEAGELNRLLAKARGK